MSIKTTHFSNYRGSYGDEEKKDYGTPNYKQRMKRMKYELFHLPYEKLLEISNEKAPNGCATEMAVAARNVLWQRKHIYGMDR